MKEIINARLIKILEDNNTKYISERKVRDMFLVLLYLKHVIEKNNYTLDMLRDTLKEETINNINSIFRFTFITNENIYLDLLTIVNLFTLDELKSNFEFKDNSIGNIIDLNKKTLIYLNYSTSDFLKIDNVDFVISSLGLYRFYSFIVDLFNLNIKVYYKDDEYSNNDYDQLLVYDETKPYIYNRAGSTESRDYERLMRELLIDFDKDIYYRTYYNNISNYRHLYSFRYLNKAIFSFDGSGETYLTFNKNSNDKISLIKYDKSISESYIKIIEKDRANKNYLLKVTREEIRTNRRKLGFGIYCNEDKSIEDLIKKNERLLSRLDYCNKTIADELDSLFIKGEI